ncbi:hypothetical protein quinque_004710 [Culex quinquefasciatus]|uniref:translation initiation factor IF-2-like n=1 Tax=Culex quinquefasciatus TaxID=7176 RepID=UPI0018E3DF9F|nr:translation initiation factor IF-2-like [Culex quinquefasciatus]
MSAKVIFIASCSLLVAVSAKPHVLAGPAFVTAQSSQVFARTYNGIVPVAVHASVPYPYPVPAPVAPAPAVFVPHVAAPVPAPVPVFSYQVYQPGPFYPVAVAAAAPAVPAVPAAPAVVTPVAAVAPAPVAKLVRKSAPYLTTIRYRSVLA